MGILLELPASYLKAYVLTKLIKKIIKALSLQKCHKPGGQGSVDGGCIIGQGAGGRINLIVCD